MWLCESVVRSSSLLSSIPTCEYRTDRFSVRALAIAASAIVNTYYEHSCTGLHADILFSFPVGGFLEVELLGHEVDLC